VMPHETMDTVSSGQFRLPGAHLRTTFLHSVNPVPHHSSFSGIG
jgi:hypothetical protein